MTSYEQECLEQQAWKLKPAWEKYPGFDQLIVNEFLPHAEQQSRTDRHIRQLVQFSMQHVPFYRDLWKTLKIKPKDINGLADLRRLPILTKRTIQKHSKALRSSYLPKGYEVQWESKTSGTTGEPLAIPRSRMTGTFFTLLKQRQLRWYRYDPMSLLAQMRGINDLPKNSAGEPVKPGETIHRASWPIVGRAFHTGEFIGFDDANPVEDKIAWLNQYKPVYLLGLSAQLEQLALAAKDLDCDFRLKGLEAISQQLTPDMEKIIEEVFQAPVHLNYGLNEVGMVAVRCPEGGQYHVHSEQCAIEIVDEDGYACKPGERGRLLVTDFKNLAMPLIRYDTDDLAEVSDSPCSCGRTLPTFREIHGRYRRTALLPPGIWEYWRNFQRCLGAMPREELRNLRQYQLQHHENGSFTLHIVKGGNLHPAFVSKIKAAWGNNLDETPAPLTIDFPDNIERPPGGKFQNFVSELFP